MGLILYTTKGDQTLRLNAMMMMKVDAEDFVLCTPSYLIVTRLYEEKRFRGNTPGVVNKKGRNI